MEPLLIITNAILLQVSQDTNLIAAGRFYPNGLEAPYVLHHPRVDTNHTIYFTYQSNRYQWTFKTEPGILQTNVSIHTPITSP